MRYITKNHQDAMGVWCLCENGSIMQRFSPITPIRASGAPVSPGDDGRQAAVAALVASGTPAAILAAATPTTDEHMIPWEGDLGFIGVETGDHRIIDEGGVTFRNTPMPYMSQFQTAYGHAGAFVTGRIDEASVDGNVIKGAGFIDSSLSEGARALRMIETQTMDRLSIDPTGGKMESEITEQDEDGWPIAWLDHYVEIEVGGVTQVSTSAFADSRIRLTSKAPVVAAAVPARLPDLRSLNIIVASADPAVDPPIEFFQDPHLSGRTRKTVSEPDANGHRRVFGHLAPWGECHIGLLDRCVLAPHSPSNYGWFQLGTMRCVDGCEIPIGSIAMGEGHANKQLSARAAAAYYDNPEWLVAHVAVGEDEHGVWFSGAMRTDLTAARLQLFQATRLSGDWRSVNGELDLIAVAAVNTGGFPVYEESVAADGHVQTLVASLEPADAGLRSGHTGYTNHALRAALAPLLDERAEQLAHRVHSKS